MVAWRVESGVLSVRGRRGNLSSPCHLIQKPNRRITWHSLLFRSRQVCPELHRRDAKQSQIKIRTPNVAIRNRKRKNGYTTYTVWM
jgi:hypothetical protein